MSNLLYDLSITTMLRSLNNLDRILAKAEALVESDEHLEAETLLRARLYPNMRPLVFQIQVATDTAKGAAARLTATEVPAWPDDEKSFADLHRRIAKAIDYLSSFEPAAFEGAEDRAIKLELPGVTLDFTGRTYLSHFVLPNFFFHVTTAYSILRHNGVDLGKRDYLGAAREPA